MWSLLRQRILWKGITGIALVGLVFYLLFNYWVMPSYTRHGVTVEVPKTKNLAFDKAAATLREKGLRAEKVVQRYNPEFSRDVIVDQQPAAGRSVKPGRRVYLTVNSGEAPYYKVPDLVHLSRRQALNQIEAHQLQIGEVQVDSVPSPYKNTVTRQEPAPGDSVQQGSKINLWVSPGQSNQFLDVPDLAGLHLWEADSLLRRNHLRLLIMSDTTGIENKDSLIVTGQHPTSGTTVREGSEIRVTADTTGAKTPEKSGSAESPQTF